MTTRSFTWMLEVGLTHLVHCWRLLRYYFDCDQKCCIIYWTCCHWSRRFIGRNFRLGLGRSVRTSPTRKWTGVRGRKSEGSSNIGVKGCELMHASVCLKNAVNSSTVRHEHAITLFIWFFISLTQSLPKHGHGHLEAGNATQCHHSLVHLPCSNELFTLKGIWHWKSPNNSKFSIKKSK